MEQWFLENPEERSGENGLCVARLCSGGFVRNSSLDLKPKQFTLSCSHSLSCAKVVLELGRDSIPRNFAANNHAAVAALEGHQEERDLRALLFGFKIKLSTPEQRPLAAWCSLARIRTLFTFTVPC